MTVRVVESEFKHVPCPCGCGVLCEQHDGMLYFGGESGGYFRALLMRDRDSEPNIWLSIATSPPADASDKRSWLVALHGNQDGARIEDSESSPISIDPAFAGRHIKRDELFSVAGAPEFYFECFDALMAHHSRLASFVLG